MCGLLSEICQISEFYISLIEEGSNPLSYDKVAMIFLRDEVSGLMIQSEELFKVFKFMFDSLWKELEGKNLPDVNAFEEVRKI